MFHFKFRVVIFEDMLVILEFHLASGFEMLRLPVIVCAKQLYKYLQMHVQQIYIIGQ